jgi:molybdenum cofactor cytidylyltransferase
VGGRTAGILLAAGLAHRMGRPKLLLDLGSKPIVRWSAERLAAHVDDLIVVTAPEAEPIQAVLAGLGARFVINPHPEHGQGTSIAAGASALAEGTVAAFVALADQPRVPDEVFTRLGAARERTGHSIVAPVYRDTQGTPVLFAAAVFPELCGLRGDAGARSVVAARRERVHLERFEFSMPEDVDTPEDYARLHVE